MFSFLCSVDQSTKNATLHIFNCKFVQIELVCKHSVIKYLLNNDFKLILLNTPPGHCHYNGPTTQLLWLGLYIFSIKKSVFFQWHSFKKTIWSDYLYLASLRSRYFYSTIYLWRGVKNIAPPPSYMLTSRSLAIHLSSIQQ